MTPLFDERLGMLLHEFLPAFLLLSPLPLPFGPISLYDVDRDALSENVKKISRVLKVGLPHDPRNPAILVHQKIIANIDRERGSKPLHVGGIAA